MNNCNIITKCPITGSSDTVTYLNLGNMPLVNNLNDSRQEDQNRTKEDLDQLLKKTKEFVWN